MAILKRIKLGNALSILCTVLVFFQQAVSVIHAAELYEINVVQLSVETPGTDDIDIDPPQVDHIPVTTGIAGTVQSFSVTAIDAKGVHSATLMVRATGQQEYQSVPMQSIPDTDSYTASVESTAGQKRLEYYFLIVDTGGNKVLSGFPYEPFERFLEATVLASDSPAGAAMAEQVSESVENTDSLAGEELSKKKSNLLVWGAIGLVVVGVLAASGGGSGSGDAGVATVPVTVNVPLPR